METQPPLPSLHHKFLDEKLAALEKAKNWSPRVISKLEVLINSPDDFQLFRINPLKFSKEKGVSEQESIDLFLHATKLGIFKMEWQVLCPHCGDTVESFGALSSVHPHYNCNLCRIESEARLDEYIQISFTIAPPVRDIKYHHPDDLSVEDFYFKYHFNQTARFPGGPTFLEAGSKLCKAVSYLQPGEKKKIEVDAPEGFFIGHDLICNSGFMVFLKGDPKPQPQVISAVLKNGKFELSQAEAAPGKIIFEVENKMPTKESIFLLLMPPSYQVAADTLEFEPFLTGNRLLTSQTFRNLYRSETVEGNEGIGVKDLTLLFTDLKGSTAMYERIGDLKAFSLVQQHFDRLGKAIQANNGAIVKTIGDAVMASFEKPVDAVKASVEMLQEIEAFNLEYGGKEIILKVGIHRGASIVVTLNDRLDYFGQTVNIAARVQGLADAEEIYLTQEVFDSPGVAGLLKGFQVDPEMANLKGIQKTMPVVRVTHQGRKPRTDIPASPNEKSKPAPPRAPEYSQEPKAGVLRGKTLKIPSSVLSAIAGLILGTAGYYFFMYLPQQEAKQRQEVARLREIKRQQEQAAALLGQKSQLPDCPLIYPLLDKSEKVTPLGSYLSYLAMKRASNLPEPVFHTPHTWEIFNSLKLFDSKPGLNLKSYRQDLLDRFNVKDRGEGQWIQTQNGYKVTLRFWGSRTEKKYQKTFGKKGLHLAPDWIAACLQDWAGFQPNPAQKAYLAKPLYADDEDLKRGPRLEGIFRSSEGQARLDNPNPGPGSIKTN